MTEHEAIKYIEQHNHIDDVGKDMAIDAINKQIPKKPKIKRFFGIIIMTCPVCGKRVIFVGKKAIDKYCDECGQKLDWSEL